MRTLPLSDCPFVRAAVGAAIATFRDGQLAAKWLATSHPVLDGLPPLHAVRLRPSVFHQIGGLLEMEHCAAGEPRHPPVIGGGRTQSVVNW
jgi:hypothetical protein